MAYDPARHHRRSIRLPDYDYAQPGWYFVTICTQHHLCLLGEVDEEVVRLSGAGRIMVRQWYRLAHHFPHLRLDAFVAMPNHVHGIIQINDLTDDPNATNPAVGADPRVRPVSDPHHPSPDPRVRPVSGPAAIPNQGAHTGAPLPRIVQWWKTMTTNAYIRDVRTRGWTPLDRRLWQRNYYERIIRDQRELDLTRRYIAENPSRWHLDRLHPERTDRPR